jgi:hypothetical protein
MLLLERFHSEAPYRYHHGHLASGGAPRVGRRRGVAGTGTSTTFRLLLHTHEWNKPIHTNNDTKKLNPSARLTSLVARDTGTPVVPGTS